MKGLLNNTILGTFSCDLGTFYFEKDHAVLKKWLLMTSPGDNDADDDDTSTEVGAPTGFLQISAMILGSGDEIPERAKVDVDVDDVEDIESNLLLPAGATLQPATFFVKIYKTEDLPQMDSGSGDFAKKIITQGEVDDHCDPYSAFTFAGRTMRTSVRGKTYTPEFNEELKISFKFPSMCERLKLQVFDWDRVGKDECIGTSFISLQAISGLGDPGKF